jgi:sterol desaturase/sphingolipid hydroxylase (fatty acid hydroxylase superfamily)
MTDWILAHALVVRLACFGGVLAAMAAWEQLASRRPWSVARATRWTSHLLLSALNTLIVRALLPLTAVGVAALAQTDGWGLFNRYHVPEALAIVLSIIALDLVIYFQHVMFHAVPVLWRVHRVHHADLDFDVTTGIRFHPIEIALSLAIKLAAILLLGAPPAAVLIFEVLLNATSLFNHGNVRMPPSFDRWLRRLVVTPDMHRVHHSIIWKETNSNFGFNLPWWDRLFGTYRDQPQAGHDGMTIGLENIRDETRVAHLAGILRMPFE